MKETLIDFDNLDVSPSVVNAAKNGGLITYEAVLYGVSAHKTGQAISPGVLQQLVKALTGRQCPQQHNVFEMLSASQVAEDIPRPSLGPLTYCSGSSCSQCPLLKGWGLCTLFHQCSLLEVFGSSGVGKSQLALAYSVHVAKPLLASGLGKKVAYIHSEGQFPSRRLNQMLEDLSPADQQTTADAIFIHHVNDLSELLHCVQYRLPKLLSAESGAVRCVVLDSVAAPFRAADKMPWPDRQAKLHSLAYGLRQIALQYNVTVLALNQVAAAMGSEDIHGTGATDTWPALGLTWASAVTSRVMLTRTHAHQDRVVRVMKVISCPWLPRTEIPFVVSRKGLEALQENNSADHIQCLQEQQ